MADAALVEALDRRIVATKTDVRDRDAMRLAIESGVGQLGRLDIVVANAGIHSFGPFWELDDAAWDDVTGAANSLLYLTPTELAARRRVRQQSASAAVAAASMQSR